MSGSRGEGFRISIRGRNILTQRFHSIKRVSLGKYHPIIKSLFSYLTEWHQTVCTQKLIPAGKSDRCVSKRKFSPHNCCVANIHGCPHDPYHLWKLENL